MLGMFKIKSEQDIQDVQDVFKSGFGMLLGSRWGLSLKSPAPPGVQGLERYASMNNNPLKHHRWLRIATKSRLDSM
jgi:hypothetical protein